MKPKPQEKTKKATDHPTQRHWREMNRKQRRETMRKIQSEDISLEVVHPDAAGIDRLGAPVAIKAMAAKLARLVYRMLCYGMKYVDQGAALYQAQHRQLQIRQLNRKAISLGYQLIRVPAV